MALDLLKVNIPFPDWPLMDGPVQEVHDVKVGVVCITVDTSSCQEGLSDVNGSFAVRYNPNVSNPCNSNSDGQKFRTTNGLLPLGSPTLNDMHLPDMLIQAIVRGLVMPGTREGVGNNGPCSLGYLDVLWVVACSICVDDSAVVAIIKSKGNAG